MYPFQFIDLFSSPLRGEGQDEGDSIHPLSCSPLRLRSGHKGQEEMDLNNLCLSQLLDESIHLLFRITFQHLGVVFSFREEYFNHLGRRTG
jgi:hypothetical protein